MDDDLELDDVVRQVRYKDIDAEELYIGGKIFQSENSKELNKAGAKVYGGVRETYEAIMEVIRKELNGEISDVIQIII
jgi:methylmalonyl-CoA mutase cobalamin-binding subunit